MGSSERPPAGPRGAVGARAEDAAARYLSSIGWVVLARNVRVGRDELDIVAREPGLRTTLVVVEVRSRSGPDFGAAIESVDRRKVSRLYRAALSLRRVGHPGLPQDIAAPRPFRVDVLTLHLDGADWLIDEHVRGIEPP